MRQEARLPNYSSYTYIYTCIYMCVCVPVHIVYRYTLIPLTASSSSYTCMQ